MPGSKSKSIPANGAAKSAKVTPASTVPPSPVPSKTDLGGTAVPAFGRPDKAVYEAQQAGIKGEIDDLQTKLVCALLKVSSTEDSQDHRPPSGKKYLWQPSLMVEMTNAQLSRPN